MLVPWIIVLLLYIYVGDIGVSFLVVILTLTLKYIYFCKHMTQILEEYKYTVSCG